MRSTTFAATAVFFSTLAAGQTFTDCQPLEKVCPADPGLGSTHNTDFTKGSIEDWELAEGTTITYDKELGAKFVISKSEAPTIGLDKFIMFGKVEVVMRASAGQGTVSSFILESSDLDEIDWEWLGADNGNVQTNFFGKGNTTTYDRGAFHPISDPINTFHTYTIDWTKDTTKWYINGALVRTLNYGDALALGGKNYPQTPMKVKMGSWIGCASAEAAADPKTKYTCEWAGGPIDRSAGPYTMYVKSVKIEDYGCGGDYTYTDMSGSYESITSSGKCDGKGSGKGSDTTAKPSSSASKTTSKPSSSSSTTAAILIETKESVNGTATATASGTKSASSNATTATTMTTATGSSTAAGSATLTESSSTTSGTAPAQISDNAAASNLPSKKYGGLDIAVAVLGLGMGYFFM